MIEYAVRRLSEEGADTLREVLTPNAALIPLPRSAPFPPGEKNVLWVPKRICEALLARRLGGSLLPLLERVSEVPKSAFARSGERPTPKRHLESMRVLRTLEHAERITLVDDVVTKGATLLAATSLVSEAFPGAAVSCFALVRTMGLVPEVESIVDPVVGWIRRGPHREAVREP